MTEEEDNALYARLLPIYNAQDQQMKDMVFGVFHQFYIPHGGTGPRGPKGAALHAGLLAHGLIEVVPAFHGAEEYEDIIAGEVAYQKAQER